MKKASIISFLFFAPIAALAAPTDLKTFVESIGGILNTVAVFIIGLSVFLLIAGILKYIQGAGDEEKVAEGRRYVIFGVFAIFIMLSFWGLALLVKNSFFTL